MHSLRLPDRVKAHVYRQLFVLILEALQRHVVHCLERRIPLLVCLPAPGGKMLLSHYTPATHIRKTSQTPDGARTELERTPNSHTSSHLRRILPRPLHPRALSSILRYLDLSRTAATSALNAPRFSTSVCVLRLTTSIILSLVCDKSGVRKW